jgi:hypothetical protein
MQMNRNAGTFPPNDCHVEARESDEPDFLPDRFDALIPVDANHSAAK